jgi:hypothetical protein
MQDVNGLDERSNVEHAVRARRIAYPYLSDPHTYGSHRLPIERVEPFLHSAELGSHLTSRIFREVAQFRTCVA